MDEILSDSIINNLAEKTRTMREEVGNLNQTEASIASTIYDVLSGIGLSRAAIRVILPDEMDVIDDGVDLVNG